VAAFFVAALLWIGPARSSEHPQYGGVLRVELRAGAVVMNPQKWQAGAPDFASNERMAALVFDRLVALDNYGRFQPQLATEWTHDAAAKRWQFVLRAGAQFTDGALLTPADVVAALRPLLPHGLQISATPGGVAIQSASAANDLLEMLSSGPYFVYKDDGAGGLLGTGPFVLQSAGGSAAVEGKNIADAAGSAVGQRLRFRFNENCWSGRPFLDGIVVSLGMPPLKALLDLQLGKADVAELSEDTARRAGQSNVKLWTSAPVTLFALKFIAPAKSDNERTLREALQVAVDRNAMARVLLQKQAEPAESFLPQWLSGYAFLFEMESNLELAKQKRGKLPANAIGAAQPLRIGLDSGNELAKLISERVAVNARAAGLTLQVVAKAKGNAGSDGANGKADVDAQLVVWRYAVLSPRGELESFANAMHWEIPEGGVREEADERYAWEKRMMDEMNVLALVVVPDFAALDGRVRNWSPAPWGEWRLADVWIDAGEKAGAKL